MTQHQFRVIQWATGRLGKLAIRHFADNQAFELTGCYVRDSDKVGRDAGEIAGIGAIGVTATNDFEAILSVQADCVYYAPARADLNEICRLLRSGKNVVTSTSFFYPTEDFREAYDAIEAACRDGGTSLHGSGIHPGYAGDLLPLILTRIVGRVERIQLFEFVNFLDGDTEPLEHLGPMGFALKPEEFHKRPNLLAGAVLIFAQSMAMIAEGLGKHIDDVAIKDEVALASSDIHIPGATIPKGTVAAQHHEWTGSCDGKPLIVFHAYYTIGDENIEPAWNCGRTRYRILVEGDPPTEMTLEGARLPGQNLAHPGYAWTAMAAVNAIPAVCAAPPGVASHLELGMVRPRGLVRG